MSAPEVDLGGGEFCIFGSMLSGLPCVMNLANAGDVAIESSSPRLLLGLGIVVLIGGNLGGGLRSNFFSSFNAGLGGSVTAVLGRESALFARIPPCHLSHHVVDFPVCLACRFRALSETSTPRMPF